ncbi:hypothetical protein F3Y22_tig00116959pilonHSYRG00049 [Hibiscus syriacus]|uniref:Uncharacterized protein n=1 Tax=Hibiscus syriacus TaxID=106335 RepID=A0A6A2XYW5_HIBSY|nr:hypothetical protein F3Y22_tig00116959pilonHSYRG00049 [Hibiscus syriacus]
MAANQTFNIFPLRCSRYAALRPQFSVDSDGMPLVEVSCPASEDLFLHQLNVTEKIWNDEQLPLNRLPNLKRFCSGINIPIEFTSLRKLDLRECRVLNTSHFSGINIVGESSDVSLDQPQHLFNEKTVVVGGCPKMKMFSGGHSNTPMLHKVVSREGTNEGRWEGSLNGTIQRMFQA